MCGWAGRPGAACATCPTAGPRPGRGGGCRCPRSSTPATAPTQAASGTRLECHHPEELVALCRDRLTRYKCPRRVEFVDELSRQDNGKIYKLCCETIIGRLRVMRKGETS